MWREEKLPVYLPLQREASHFSVPYDVDPGETFDANADAFAVFPSMHKGMRKTSHALAAAASILVVTLLIAHCRFSKGKMAASRSMERRLAAGKRNGGHQEGTGLRICEDAEDSGVHVEEGAFPGDPLPTTAGPAQARAEPEGYQPGKKKRKTETCKDLDDVTASQGKPRGEWDVSSVQLIENVLREQETSATLASPHCGCHGPEAIAEMEHTLGPQVTVSESTATTATRTSLPKASGSENKVTGCVEQREKLELNLQAATDLQGKRDLSSSLPKTSSASMSDYRLQAPSEMMHKLIWDASATSVGAISAEVPLLHHSVSPGSLAVTQLDASAASVGAISAEEPQSHQSASPGSLAVTLLAVSSTGGLSHHVVPTTEHGLQPGNSHYEQNLFYRLPQVPSVPNLVPVRMQMIGATQHMRGLANVLKPLRRLFIREQLASFEVQNLAYYVEELLNYVMYNIDPEATVKTESQAIDIMGQRLLIADALLCACELAGEAVLKDKWWSTLLVPILKPPRTSTTQRTLGAERSGQDAQCMQRFIVALDQYRQGVRPSAKVVVELKYELFFNRPPSSKFRAVSWSAWRDDYRNSLKRLDADESPSPSSSMRKLPAAREMTVEAVPSTSGVSTNIGGGREEESSTDDKQYSTHILYRLPKVQKTLGLAPFSLLGPSLFTPSDKLGDILFPMWELLVKEHLTLEEAHLLAHRSKALLQYCIGRLRISGIAKRPIKILSQLARRFFAADALWSACEVLGPTMNKSEWWAEIMGPLLAPPSHYKVSSRSTKSAARSGSLLLLVIPALELYRQGERPRASVVVRLKQALLNHSALRGSLDGLKWKRWISGDEGDSAAGGST